MTLRNRLYMSFGAVLVMVLVMFFVNWRAVSREHEAKKAASTSLQLAEATDAVKFQMMQNRLYLSNYLLSGDTREVDRMNEGIRQLNDKLDKTRGPGGVGPAKNGTRESSAAGAELGQGVCPAPGR